MTDATILVFKEKKGDKKIKIYNDIYAENPRTWMDHLGIMVCFHKNYDLGDKHDLKSESFSGWDNLKQHLIKEHKATIIMPLFLYDHSGITISCSNSYPYNDRWDAGQV